MDELQYSAFKRRFYRETGIDLNFYKERQMRRRINQWLERVGLGSYFDLLRLIREDANERRRFLEYLTINTSHFFRDATVFNYINQTLLPEVVSAATRPRIWSAGCSIGAEIYTIAMLLTDMKVSNSYLIGTDIDTAALAQARAGRFSADKVEKELPHSFLQRYFQRQDGCYILDSRITRQVQFYHHDLLKDPFPGKPGGPGGRSGEFDVVLCRNVFIYFTPETQLDLVSRFTEVLRPGGYFIIGSAEQIPQPAAHKLERMAHCIYRHKS